MVRSRLEVRLTSHPSERAHHAPLNSRVRPHTQMATAARANTFNTGMAAEFFVLSQLFRMGFEAYLSQGNKKAIDIRVVHGPHQAISIDVKAVRSYSSLVVNNVVAGTDHFVAFVTYNRKFEDLTRSPEVFIVPSADVAAITKHFQGERRVMKGSLAKYKDNWGALRARRNRIRANI